MCYADDAHGWVNVDTWPTARKPHRCLECDRTILAGEPYKRTACIGDSTADTVVTCAHCARLADWVMVLCGGYAFGEVLAGMREHLSRAEAPEWGTTFPWRDRLIVTRALRHAQRGWRRPDGTGRPLPVLPPVPAAMRGGEEARATRAHLDRIYQRYNPLHGILL